MYCASSKISELDVSSCARRKSQTTARPFHAGLFQSVAAPTFASAGPKTPEHVPIATPDSGSTWIEKGISLLEGDHVGCAAASYRSRITPALRCGPSPQGENCRLECLVVHHLLRIFPDRS